jgi:hypothetical protein
MVRFICSMSLPAGNSGACKGAKETLHTFPAFFLQTAKAWLLPGGITTRTSLKGEANVLASGGQDAAWRKRGDPLAKRKEAVEPA